MLIILIIFINNRILIKLSRLNGEVDYVNQSFELIHHLFTQLLNWELKIPHNNILVQVLLKKFKI